MRTTPPDVGSWKTRDKVWANNNNKNQAKRGEKLIISLLWNPNHEQKHVESQCVGILKKKSEQSVLIFCSRQSQAGKRFGRIKHLPGKQQDTWALIQITIPNPNMSEAFADIGSDVTWQNYLSELRLDKTTVRYFLTSPINKISERVMPINRRWGLENYLVIT